MTKKKSKRIITDAEVAESLLNPPKEVTDHLKKLMDKFERECPRATSAGVFNSGMKF